MKTLDEVITELEDEGVFPDALHYLKEYRDDRKNFSEAISNCGKTLNKYIMDIHTLAQQEENLPLTWDELRTMEGEPVWVEKKIDDGYYSHWGIIKGFVTIGNDWMHLCGFLLPCHKFSFARQQQGKTWQAYRKERNETN